MCSNALNSTGKPAVLPMSQLSTLTKKHKRGEFKTPPRPTAAEVIYRIVSRKG